MVDLWANYGKYVCMLSNMTDLKLSFFYIYMGSLWTFCEKLCPKNSQTEQKLQILYTFFLNNLTRKQYIDFKYCLSKPKNKIHNDHNISTPSSDLHTFIEKFCNTINANNNMVSYLIKYLRNLNKNIVLIHFAVLTLRQMFIQRMCVCVFQDEC